MKLMFLHPVDYGRKAEELLWRKVYYEVIQLIKTNKKAGIAGWGGQPAGPWVRLSKRLLCLEMCRLSTQRCWVRAELTAEFSQKHRCQGLGGMWKAHPAQRGSSTQNASRWLGTSRGDPATPLGAQCRPPRCEGVLSHADADLPAGTHCPCAAIGCH